MKYHMEEKIAICYTCCGPTYRKTAKEKLINLHEDNPNIYYFIITDDKNYFKDIQRKNLVVNELKDFYNDFPHLKKYESFLESENENDYAEKFIKLDYKFPFSTNRFHLLQAKNYDIKNVAMLSTDTDLNLENFSQIDEKINILYNCVSWWDSEITDNNMMYITEILKKYYNLEVDKIVRVFDGAGKCFFSKILTL